MNKKATMFLVGLLIIGGMVLCFCIGFHISPWFGEEVNTMRETKYTEDELTEAETETETVSPVEQFHWHWLDKNGQIAVLDYLPTTDSREEYDAFCWYFAEHFPEGFVSYHELAELGSFGSFVFYPWDDSGVITSYSYVLYGDDCVNLDIALKHLHRGESRDIRDHVSGDHYYDSSSNEDTSDMRRSEHTLTSVILNNTKYFYDKEGCINHIVTIIDGYKITINQRRLSEADKCLADYDLEAENFVAYLLAGADHQTVSRAFRNVLAGSDEP